MNTLFDPRDRDALRLRFTALQAGSHRQWGKMDPAQMLAHCSRALEMATTDQPVKQAFLGKLLMPFIRRSIFGEKPFRRNAPTDPTFVVSDEREFHAEVIRLAHLIDRFAQRGPQLASKGTHSFFGKLSGEEWGVLVYKHLDHHLRQFGV